MNWIIKAEGVAKTFVLHTQSGVRLPVLTGVDLEVARGDCVVLAGPSGAGKSTLLRALYANYQIDRGRVLVRHDGDTVDMAAGEPRAIIDVRRRTMGYVSQFLRVIPRVPTLKVVAEPLRRLGVEADEAEARAGDLLARLNIPERLWHLPPATFSGGEQQRVNIAHGFIAELPVLLLDEPTASLDADNRAVVVELIAEAKARGAAIVGIFHDTEVREQVATRVFTMSAYGVAA